MSDIFTERKDDGTWRALQNHRTIVTGDTQLEAAEKAHEMKPEDPVFGERVRFTKGGKPDKWRRMF